MHKNSFIKCEKNKDSEGEQSHWITRAHMPLSNPINLSKKVGGVCTCTETNQKGSRVISLMLSL